MERRRRRSGNRASLPRLPSSPSHPFAFPLLPLQQKDCKILDTKSQTLRMYVFLSALLGIFPVAYICEDIKMKLLRLW
ncbi:unnamed protein product [Linum tenue]|uniref:Uncharacterized protein n=1 Tax=Linum tenue TaxID=586396 RepID=A0AAV0PJ88_9ROSI|nr:unnamed protein product [Linum tenue]